MKFVVGCDSEEFKRYYRTLDDLHSYFKTLGLTDVKFGELGEVEAGIIKRDPSHLIVWKENSSIIVMQSGMKPILKNIERETPEKKKIEKHWKGFLAERKISLSFTKSG
ncbi:MAG: hypothetical protein OEZ29_05520 [Candidatus Bathyarchaeota archaeon]|nr:hypothetical protein [Candidatus Bathyarchaeota archaeon]